MIQKFLHKHYKKIVFAILLFMLVISLRLAWRDGTTFDEIAHIPAGYSYVTQGDYRLNPEHPPALKVLAGLPLVPLNLSFDTAHDFWTVMDDFGEYGQWDAGRHLLYGAGNNPDTIVFWSRVPIVLISVLFGLFLFRWGRELGGISAGLLVLVLYTFDPNILGHNHFVTTDLGIAIAITLSFYYFLAFIKKPSWENVLLGGLFLGLAQITKFSAVMLVPIFGAFLIAYPLIRTLKKGNRTKLFFSYIGKGAVALLVAVCVIWIAYIPVTINMGPEVLDQIGPGKIDPHTTLRNKYSLEFILWANESPLTRPLGTYMQGVVQVFHRVSGGNGAYFLGEVSDSAFPLYFPFVFLTKETIPHLLFYIFALGLFIRLFFRGTYDTFTQSPKKSLLQFFSFVSAYFVHIALGSFIVFYAYISITGNLNIGFRHLFPILPLLYVLTAKVLVDFVRSLKNRYHANILATSGVIMSVFVIIVTLGAYPFYMSYFNGAVGGSHKGFTYVTDSNADWGQDAKRLRDYLNEHPEIDKMRINYFGGDRIAYHFPNRVTPWWDSKRPIEKGYYAVSVNYRQGSIFDTRKSDDESYRWLLDTTLAQKSNQEIVSVTLVDQVGTSILIYKVE